MQYSGQILLTLGFVGVYKMEPMAGLFVDDTQTSHRLREGQQRLPPPSRFLCLGSVCPVGVLLDASSPLAGLLRPPLQKMTALDFDSESMSFTPLKDVKGGNNASTNCTAFYNNLASGSVRHSFIANYSDS